MEHSDTKIACGLVFVEGELVFKDVESIRRVRDLDGRARIRNNRSRRWSSPLTAPHGEDDSYRGIPW